MCTPACNGGFITDFASRYLLACEGLASTREHTAFTVIEHAFKEFGLPGAPNLLQQQARCDDFIDDYNRERPHQALGLRYPAELYAASARPYRGLEVEAALPMPPE